MELTPMQYKSYVWPHNPRTYTIQYVRKVAVHKVPFGRYAMQDLGLGRRVMKGEGEFYGAGAYEEFKKLASVFYHSGPGTLIHPVWQSAKAYFVDLTLAQEPRQDYVRCFGRTMTGTGSSWSLSVQRREAADRQREGKCQRQRCITRWSRGRPCGALRGPGA